MKGSAISRRLMLALFAVTLVPILGWSLVVDLAERLTARQHPPSIAELGGALHETRHRLVLILGASLLTFAGALLYLRRVLVTPLESLAEKARRASVEWDTPRECERDDEIGDLGRALDKSVRDLAERAERARRFSADLSHELRTPLAAIRGAAELLSDGALPEHEARRLNENVLRESERLGRLVEGILDLERATHTQHHEEASADLAQSLQRVTDGLAVLAARRDQRFQLQLDTRTAWALVDADRHDRVLYALLENALKFSPNGEVVEVRLVTSADRFRITVSDRGPGVAESAREAIFERHVQGETR
ncbi:MAG TPA: histidine kinase dimerization/phospho-acceptor domain-containing protein, partial [Polyangiaceae bacterium]